MLRRHRHRPVPAPCPSPPPPSTTVGTWFIPSPPPHSPLPSPPFCPHPPQGQRTGCIFTPRHCNHAWPARLSSNETRLPVLDVHVSNGHKQPGCQYPPITVKRAKPTSSSATAAPAPAGACSCLGSYLQMERKVMHGGEQVWLMLR